MTETELIFSSVLNLNRTQLYLGDYKISNEQADRLAGIFCQRAEGEPLQYILGKAHFFGLEFEVNESVLIPRPETEILVENAIDISRKNSLFKILDIGTGSGCIAVSIARNVKEAFLDASDISLSALSMAQKNIFNHDVAQRVRLFNADLFPASGLYGLIVSNPPYIPSAELVRLSQQVRYEPVIALDAGGDGLDSYRRIAASVGDYLTDGGFLIMEIGYAQGGAVKNILEDTHLFDKIELVEDYSGIQRVIIAREKSYG